MPLVVEVDVGEGLADVRPEEQRADLGGRQPLPEPILDRPLRLRRGAMLLPAAIVIWRGEAACVDRDRHAGGELLTDPLHGAIDRRALDDVGAGELAGKDGAVEVERYGLRALHDGAPPWTGAAFAAVGDPLLGGEHPAGRRVALGADRIPRCFLLRGPGPVADLVDAVDALWGHERGGDRRLDLAGRHTGEVDGRKPGGQRSDTWARRDRETRIGRRRDKYAPPVQVLGKLGLRPQPLGHQPAQILVCRGAHGRRVAELLLDPAAPVLAGGVAAFAAEG